MSVAIRSFVGLTAEDVMSRDVVRIPQELSLLAAARLLWRERIHGAPVVDEEGVCVGVLSATDFLTMAGGLEAHAGSTEGSHPLCVFSEGQVIEPEDLPPDEVRVHMTADPVTAATDTPISELARLMLEARVHRVIIVDSGGRPIGVTSSTDLIAAIARDGANTTASESAD